MHTAGKSAKVARAMNEMKIQIMGISKTRRQLEHLTEVLNREIPSNPISETEIELPDEVEEIDTSESSRAEVRKAIGHLKNGKVPGIENIQALTMLPLKGKEIIDVVTSVERRKDTRKMEEKSDHKTAEKRKSDGM